MTGNKQIVKHEVVEDKVITQKPKGRESAGDQKRII